MNTNLEEPLMELRESAKIFALRAVEQLWMLCTLETANQLVDSEHGIAWRIKDAEAIRKKLLPEKSKRHINDFIGIRILSEHLHQIPVIETKVDSWTERIGLTCLKRENVFEHPDPSGYRSIHLDYRFLRPEEWSLTPEATVEVQITTWLQHFHNSLSHKLYYKPVHPPSPATLAALRNLCVQIEAIEQQVDHLVQR